MTTNKDLQDAGLSQEEMCAFWDDQTRIRARKKANPLFQSEDDLQIKKQDKVT